MKVVKLSKWLKMNKCEDSMEGVRLFVLAEQKLSQHDLRIAKWSESLKNNKGEYSMAHMDGIKFFIFLDRRTFKQLCSLNRKKQKELAKVFDYSLQRKIQYINDEICRRNYLRWEKEKKNGE